MGEKNVFIIEQELLKAIVGIVDVIGLYIVLN